MGQKTVIPGPLTGAGRQRRYFNGGNPVFWARWTDQRQFRM